MSDEHGVLYGGPDIPLIEADCTSMGEVVLRKLAESRDKVLVVSILVAHTCLHTCLSSYRMSYLSLIVRIMVARDLQCLHSESAISRHSSI